MAGRGINKVILVGNVGRDPEIRYTRNNQAVANFSLATTESVFDRESNSRDERTEWHRLVCFGRLVEIIEKYVKKGHKLYVEGRLQTRKWEDQRTNQMRYSTEIICSEVVMLNNPDSAGYERSSKDSSSEYSGYSSDSNSSPTNDDNQTDDFADDLPW